VRSGYRRSGADRLSAAVMTSPGDEKGDHNHGSQGQGPFGPQRVGVTHA